MNGGKIGRKIYLPNSTAAQWSSTGDRLVVTQWSKSEPGLSFVIIDATTSTTRTHRVDRDKFRCAEHCFFQWHRNGREVGYALTDTAQSGRHLEDRPDAHLGVQLFDVDTGAPTRFLPVKGAAFGPYAWSPDGTRVVVEGVDTSANSGRRLSQTQIRDTRTGELLGTLPYPARQIWWATDDLLFALNADFDTITVVRPDGTVTEAIALGDALGDRWEFTLAPR